MTRKQYEEMYGVKPVLPVSTDFEPTPIPMTRAEYDQKYGLKLPERDRGFGVLETQKAGIENIQTGLTKIFQPPAITEAKDVFDEGVVKGTLETLFRGLRAGSEAVTGLGRVVGGVAQFGLAPVLGPSVRVGEAIGEQVGKVLPTGVGQFAEDTAKNKIATQALEDILDISNLILPEVGLRGAKALEPVRKTIETKLQTGEITPPQVRTFFEKQVSNQALKDLKTLRKNYAQLRNNPGFDDASLQRIADTQARTGFLNNATDADGTIITKSSKIADLYRKATIDGSEGVVRQLLKREGEKVNINQIESALLRAIDKNYEGSVLIAARNNIKKELEGLAERADELGNVPLDKVQDFKIASTKYLDYTKPASASLKKLKGRIYKEIIENNSKATIEVDGKPRTIKDINKELQKYYTDIENLEALDGKKATGGRLGKMASQVIGAIIGTSAGQFAGPLGGALGGMVGVEAGGALRGAQMASTFGRGKRGTLPPNAILQKAKDVGATPPKVNLRVPDKKIGVPPGVPKTKEIVEIEARINKNVEAQKKAIREGDFTLVATLKEIYRALVEKLKEFIEKASRATERGFARLDLGQSKSEGNRNNIQANIKGKSSHSTTPNDTTPSDAFQGFTDLSTKLLEKLKGRTTVSRQFIEDLSNSPDLKQAERDLIRRVLEDFSPKGFGVSDTIPNNTVGRGTLQKPAQRLSQTTPSSSNTSPRSSVNDSIKNEVNQALRVEVVGDRELYDFISKARGSATQFGEYNPTLRKYGIGEKSKRVSELGIDPNQEITIYRGISEDAPRKEINEGDFVTTSYEQALAYTDSPERVVSKKVKVSDLITQFPDEFLDDVKKYGLNAAMEGEVIYSKSTNPILNISKEDLTKFFNDVKGGKQANIFSGTSDQISVPDFANKVKSELLPLKRSGTGEGYDYKPGERNGTRYENITLPDELRGPIAKYDEHVYESPIKTSAGDAHFSGYSMDNYFAHTRIEDLPTSIKDDTRSVSQQFKDAQSGKIGSQGGTRRVIELQSDLFQKGRLDDEFTFEKRIQGADKIKYDRLKDSLQDYNDDKTLERIHKEMQTLKDKWKDSTAPASKLEPYRNTWHERVIREEVKQAALDGKTKLQFPTGETIDKIEGHATNSRWIRPENMTDELGIGEPLTKDMLKVGEGISDGETGWIITDVLGDGKFKAVPKRWEEMNGVDRQNVIRDFRDTPPADRVYKTEQEALTAAEKHIAKMRQSVEETFDISGKKGPKHDFYEKQIGKYLKNKYGATLVTDPQGVTWWEVNVKPEYKKLPIEAFGVGLTLTGNNND